jgi:hypothetical protein
MSKHTSGVPINNNDTLGVSKTTTHLVWQKNNNTLGVTTTHICRVQMMCHSDVKREWRIDRLFDRALRTPKRSTLRGTRRGRWPNKRASPPKLVSDAVALIAAGPESLAGRKHENTGCRCACRAKRRKAMRSVRRSLLPRTRPASEHINLPSCIRPYCKTDERAGGRGPYDY